MPEARTPLRIAFIGGGVMASAILRSLLNSGLAEPAGVAVSDPSAACREAAAALGIRALEDNRAAIEGAEVVLLAVKPDVVPRVLDELGPHVRTEQLVVSIAPGYTTAQIEERLPEGTPVVRVMPNTPVMVDAGASAFCRGRAATPEHAARVQEIFSAGGRCEEVAEKLMDAVTGLSGSGPAYGCVIIEALADGGVRMGLPRPVALALAAQTLLGAAKLVLETGEHPAVWKDRVATPGGTTIAGLAALEHGGLRGTLIAAVEAAATRSAELGKR